MNQVVLRRKWQSTTGGDGCDDHDYDDDNDDVHCIKDEDEVEVGIISLSGW